MTGNKKAASGAEDTESGKGKSTISSVSESPGNVKAPPEATAASSSSALRRFIRAMEEKEGKSKC